MYGVLVCLVDCHPPLYYFSLNGQDGCDRRPAAVMSGHRLTLQFHVDQANVWQNFELIFPRHQTYHLANPLGIELELVSGVTNGPRDPTHEYGTATLVLDRV